jgi:hypothetical protein
MGKTIRRAPKIIYKSGLKVADVLLCHMAVTHVATYKVQATTGKCYEFKKNVKVACHQFVTN